MFLQLAASVVHSNNICSTVFGCAQVGSEGTLEDAEGVYASVLGPDTSQCEPVSMARFMALHSLWLRQATVQTLEGVQLSESTTLRRAVRSSVPASQHVCSALTHYCTGNRVLREGHVWKLDGCWMDATPSPCMTLHRALK